VDLMVKFAPFFEFTVVEPA
jgi:hypothetical protein